MKDLNCIDCNNSNCFINLYCSDEWKKILDENKIWGVYQKGQHIFFEGAPVYGIYFILSGKVKVFTSSLNKREKILRLAQSGDILGHRGYGSKFYGISAVALETSKICFIENDIFFKAVKANNELSFQLMMFYAQELYKSEQHSKNITLMPAIVRVADILIQITDKFGIYKKNKWEPDINLSRQEIADMASTTPEFVSRSLTEFKNDSIISTSGRRIIINNLEKLRNLTKPYENINNNANNKNIIQTVDVS